MNASILIVEDEFLPASDLSDMVTEAGYDVCATADTFQSAKKAVDQYQPTWVLLYIFLQDGSMGIELNNRIKANTTSLNSTMLKAIAWKNMNNDCFRRSNYNIQVSNCFG